MKLQSHQTLCDSESIVSSVCEKLFLRDIFAFPSNYKGLRTVLQYRVRSTNMCGTGLTGIMNVKLKRVLLGQALSYCQSRYV